jgi:hypothetical protein
MLRLIARALAVLERGHFLLITAGGSAVITGAVLWSFAQLTNAPVVAQAFLGAGVFCLSLLGVQPLARRALAPYERRRQIEALVDNLRTLVNELSGFLAARGVDVPRPGELQAYWQRLREGPSGALAQLRAVADDVETMASTTRSSALRSSLCVIRPQRSESAPNSRAGRRKKPVI